MSIHLIERAALLELAPSKKLVLMSFADAADRDSRVAAPGLENVQRWAGVGRSRVMELVAELVTDGLLAKHSAGHRGRRAEYIVLPFGCCGDHDPADGFYTVEGSDSPDPNDSKGSGSPDSSTADRSPNGSSGPDPTDGKGSGKGPERVHSRPDPFPASQKEPPHPPAAAGGDCPRHGTTPGPNCRACGTTARQQRDRERRTATDAAREQARADAAARRTAQARASPPPPGWRDQTRSTAA